MMLRGTVYVVTEDSEGNRIITRRVVQYAVLNLVEFRHTAEFNFRKADDQRIEFGPIGLPWRTMKP